jgi:two-component system sensor kinase FixL
MQQVILNLLRNAAEAMSGDGAPREAGHRQGPRAVWITARRDGEAAIVISVRDNGPGISPRIRGTLFDHFVTTRPGGLGMGLAISRSIVEAHEGRLWVDPGDGTGAATGKGAGATFHISLPIRSSRSPAPETGPGEPASQP